MSTATGSLARGGLLAAAAILGLAGAGCGSGSVSGGAPTNGYVGATPNGTGRGTCVVSADCDDGNYCNGTDDCVDGYCRRNAEIDCDDEVDCTIDVCDEVANRCQNTPDDSFCNDGESCNLTAGCGTGITCEIDDDCDDDIFCNGSGRCGDDGVCVEGEEVTCDDGNDCTVDTCSEENHSCSHLVRDNDRDGHGDSACRGGSDCDDDDPGINPGAREICGDGIDNDCDRDRDCNDALCEDSAECGGDVDRDRDDDRDVDRDVDRDRDRDEICDDGRDNDDDGRVDCRDSDCDRAAFCGGRDDDRRDNGRRNERRDGRDPCEANGWYNDNTCDDVCWRRDSACDRARDRNRDRNRDRDQGARRDPRDQRARDRGVDQRDQRNNQNGACGRVPHTGQCADRKTLEICTGEGRNERLQRRTCESDQECRSERGQRAECTSVRGSLPSGWNTRLCPADWATDSGCDCGCGGVDPRCNGNGCTGAGCTTGSACGWCWAGTSESNRSDACPGGVTANGGTNLPSGWNTNLCPASWATDAGCDCGCGGVDPRCNGNGCTGPGCTSGSACEFCWAGTSESNRTNACEDGVAASQGALPSGWSIERCPASWATDQECDCGCGGVDPRCNGNGCTGAGCTTGSACQYCWSGNGDARQDMCDGGVADGANSSLPAGWNTEQCPAGWANDSECDCGCGGVDPTCNGNGCTGQGCTTGSACNYCWSGRGDARQDMCEGGVQNGAGNGNLPAGWNTDRCPAGWAADSECDCGCGGVDPTCDGNGCTGAGCTTGSACNYCWTGSGEDVDDMCEGGVQQGGNGNLPAGWDTDRCEASYASDDDCDCGCGGADPTCNGNGCTGAGCTSGSACMYCWNASGQNVCQGGVQAGGQGGNDLPSGWDTDRCDASYATDGDCDCGCGGVDSACNGNGCTGAGCTSGSACEYCWGNDGQVNCAGGVEEGGDLPSGWDTDRCDASYATDGDCDCGCGGVDSACNGNGCTGAGCTSGSACEYCWGNSGQVECAGGADDPDVDDPARNCNEGSWYRPCSGECSVDNYNWDEWCVDGDGYPDAGTRCCVNDTDGSADDPADPEDPADPADDPEDPVDECSGCVTYDDGCEECWDANCNSTYYECPQYA